MPDLLAPGIFDVQRSALGLFITLENGKCALYPWSLIRAIFPQAEEMFPATEQE